MNQQTAVSMFQNSCIEQEPFNYELFSLKENNINELPEYIDDIAKALEVVDGVKYLGYTVEKSEEKLFNETYLSLKPTRVNLVTLEFKISFKGEEKEISIPLYIPKLIKGRYFLLNGNYYIPIFQMVDSSVFKSSNTYSLKTLLMNVIFKYSKNTINFESGGELEYTKFNIHIFKLTDSPIYFYLAHLGLQETIKYFGYEGKIGVVECEYNDFEETTNIDNRLVHIFKVNKTLMIYVYKDVIKTDYDKNIIGMIINAFNSNKMKYDKVITKDFWIKKLGSFFTTNITQQEEKGNNILRSLMRILDERTKKNLVNAKPEEKEDIFAVMKYMISIFNEVYSDNSTDIKHKRLRVSEFIIYPLIVMLSKKTYTILNTKNPDLKNLEKIFKNISPRMLIKRLLTNELLRYDNNTNDIDLFSSLLKFTLKGEGGISSGSSEISVKHRSQNESFIGRIGLNHASAGDPGSQSVLLPFTQLNGLYFK